VRSLMALSVIGAALFMWVTGREMTQAQEIITSGVVGAYFVVRQLGSGVSLPDRSPQRDLLSVRSSTEDGNVSARTGDWG
jgi:hypothetical protein